MNKFRAFFTKLVLIVCVLSLTGCEWKLRTSEDEDSREKRVEVNRYDRLQSLYLQTGDFSALQQMNTSYPMETRTLIEKMLRIGTVDDPEINNKFLKFYQDTTLQAVISDAETQYANMDDINRDLTDAFAKLESHIPNFPVPAVYAQIGALDQSIVVGDGSIGISLDKYLGEDYPLYKRYEYSEQQRQTMTRKFIVPDCMSFYLISLYPMSNYEERSQMDRDLHMGKVMWVVNRVMARQVFHSRYISIIDRYMHHHPRVTYEKLLKMEDYSPIYPDTAAVK
ncbi:MAG: gliding motility protein GldB [Prevotella sp.]|nr:gliding motility protein GldB [Prevotella sp.]